MDPVGFKKGHPTWEFYVNAKGSLDTSSEGLLSFSLKFDFKITLHFIYVLQLNQLEVCCLNFSAKVSRQEAAERERADKLTFEKSSVVMARWLENQNTTSLANDTSSSLKEDQIVPLQCLPGEAKLLKNDWKWMQRRPPRTTATSKNLTFSLGLIHQKGFAKDVKWIVWANDSLIWESQNKAKLYRIAKPNHC